MKKYIKYLFIKQQQRMTKSTKTLTSASRSRKIVVLAEEEEPNNEGNSSDKLASMMQQIKLIREMRKAADAPVDTMGCHTCPDPNADPKTFRFQVLTALMLSSQTKDQVTSAAMERLKTRGCTIPNLIEMPEKELSELLKPVGFYKRKTEYLKKVCVILRDKYNQDIPNTFEGLCSLPGVGPKMANLTLQIAFDRVEGIGVDTHVHRISNRLRWVKTKTPEETEYRLREALPRSEWNSINQLLVGFGQTICLPVNPKCSECLNNKLCPGASRKRVMEDGS